MKVRVKWYVLIIWFYSWHKSFERNSFFTPTQLFICQETLIKANYPTIIVYHLKRNLMLISKGEFFFVLALFLFCSYSNKIFVLVLFLFVWTKKTKIFEFWNFFSDRWTVLCTKMDGHTRQWKICEKARCLRSSVFLNGYRSCWSFNMDGLGSYKR